MHLNNRGWGTKEMILMTAFLLILLGITWYYISTLYDGALVRNARTFSNSYYKTVQSNLESAAERYYEDKGYTGTAILSYSLLKDEGYISNIQDFLDASCTGYVIASNGSFKPYIKCNNYTSEGYVSEFE